MHEGVLAEQFVAQHLAFFGGVRKAPTAYYWLREGKSENAEIDFVCQFGSSIVPIEVKSAKAEAYNNRQAYSIRVLSFTDSSRILCHANSTNMFFSGYLASPWRLRARDYL